VPRDLLGEGSIPSSPQNVADRLPTDAVDAESPKFSENAGVAGTGFTGDLANQFAQHELLTRSSGLGRLVASAFLPHPTLKRAGCDDRDQLHDVVAQRFAKLEQPRTLLGRRMDLAGDACSKNRQFLFQILNVPGQHVFGGIGNQQQQWVKQAGHFVSLGLGGNRLSDRERALFLYPVETPSAMNRSRFGIPHKATNAMNKSALCLFDRSPASWSFVATEKVNSKVTFWRSCKCLFVEEQIATRHIRSIGPFWKFARTHAAAWVYGD
jgi:hypothetical protein